jgi:hypothetical protein
MRREGSPPTGPPPRGSGCRDGGRRRRSSIPRSEPIPATAPRHLRAEAALRCRQPMSAYNSGNAAARVGGPSPAHSTTVAPVPPAYGLRSGGRAGSLVASRSASAPRPPPRRAERPPYRAAPPPPPCPHEAVRPVRSVTRPPTPPRSAPHRPPSVGPSASLPPLRALGTPPAPGSARPSTRQATRPHPVGPPHARASGTPAPCALVAEAAGPPYGRRTPRPAPRNGAPVVPPSRAATLRREISGPAGPTNGEASGPPGQPHTSARRAGLRPPGALRAPLRLLSGSATALGHRAKPRRLRRSVPLRGGGGASPLLT